MVAVLTARMLSVRPAVWIGDLSYSWYLWHWPLIVFAQHSGLVQAGRLPLLLQSLSSPPGFRTASSRTRSGSAPGSRGRAVFALAAICVAVPIGACLGLVETTRVLAGQQTMKSYERSQTRHADLLRGCDGPTPLGQRTAGACTWRVARPRGQVVLIGDSNAGHFSEAVIRAANRAGFELTIATFSACPFIDLEWRNRRTAWMPAVISTRAVSRRWFGGGRASSSMQIERISTSVPPPPVSGARAVTPPPTPRSRSHASGIKGSHRRCVASTTPAYRLSSCDKFPCNRSSAAVRSSAS